LLKGGKYSQKFTISVIWIFILLFIHIYYAAPQDSSDQTPVPASNDSIELKYPFRDDIRYPFSQSGITSPLILGNPSNIDATIVYDPDINQYIFSEKVGEFNIRPQSSMSLDEYREYESNTAIKNYWRKKSREEITSQAPSFLGKIRMGETFDKVFGTDAINIVPQGSAELIFGYNRSRIDNPALSERNRRNGAFTFKEKIQMNVTGSIGDKMELGINYNTEATFDFENKTKLEYAGHEDEIIKKIEAGNISFPLTGSLISGSQSLFGLKTELQFGKLTVTNVFSHQRGESSSIEVRGGAQVSEFEVTIDNYDANRHFFLSHFFRDNYNSWLGSLPYITSGVRIEQIEVWITNKTSEFDKDNRNIIALMDLGESYGPDQQPNFFGDPYFIRPGNQINQSVSNDANGLYSTLINNYSGIRDIRNITNVLEPLINSYNFLSGQDYEKIENARKLTEREYTVNRELGYISLNSALRSDEVLAVAYVYTYRGQTYRVGELSTDGISAPRTLIVKLIKGTSLTPKLGTWDLMMKNVYAIGAYQVNSQDFRLDVLYRNDETGVPVNYISDPRIANNEDFYNTILLRVLNLDNLDIKKEPNPDGLFDFIEGVTIHSSNGRVIFPVLEPFGSDLKKIINNNQVADDYIFEELYDSTQTKAKQIAEKNKFFLAGTYQSSSSSEIQLNAMNIPRGSVKVTAGGIQLQEGIDYTVDYVLGRVKILNQGYLESGTPLRVSLESNQLFNLQTKTLLGTHLDYKISDNFNIGGTLLNLTERPLTQKVNMGEEPISNTIWGVNTSYRTESHLLTSLIDKLPLIETKEVSSIVLDAEFAQLIPGQARAIGKGGIAYIDDFEGTETTIEMKSLAAWVLSSAPRGQSLFPEAELNDNLEYGHNRAKIAWYIIDPLFTRKTGRTPKHITEDDVSGPFVREVKETEIYTQKESGTGFDSPISILNVAYYPKDKGPYNYDTDINNNGELNNPRKRWGGIMREIQTSDFETSNVEYIEFWLMDPFVLDSTHTGGDLYFNLGEISEDILRDSRKTFENGLPISDTDTLTLVDYTSWGRVPRTQSIVNAFNTDPETREYQDVGLDGLGDEAERSYFGNYIEQIRNTYGDQSAAFQKTFNDPSSDNFHYYLGADYDEDELGVINRYKDYNGLEGNSPPTEGEFAAASTLPSGEDINRDNTLNETETYFQYKVELRPDQLNVNNKYITDIVNTRNVNWYQFRIPIVDFERKVGNIEDFKSIRFMRMFMTNFDDSVILRFAELHLVRSEWRKYKFNISEGGPSIVQQIDPGSFEISAVNIEENSAKEPVNYVLPPGITRVIDPSQPQVAQLNEQSIVFKVSNLPDGDARVAYKNVDLDLRQYKKLKMFVHAEALQNEELNDYDISAFIRIGSDYKDNFYEYEVPLVLTQHRNNYDNDDDADRLLVWPEDNVFEIDLEKFVELKKERDQAVRSNNMIYSKIRIYSKFDDKNRIKVRGTPNLSNIRTIMIGIRNPGDLDNQNDNDGLTKSAEIWFNELRLTDFNNKGGWAANARMQTKLADLGTLSIAGSTIQPGFGSIEQKVEQRKKEELVQYDISSNIELGKLFPEKANVSVPMFVGVSKSIINPEYYPKEPDRLLKEVLVEAESKSQKQDIKEVSQDVMERKSINFTNVRVSKEVKKFRIISPTNLSLSVAYSEEQAHNYSIEKDNNIRYRAALNYTYSTRPKNIIPFRKSTKFKSPYLKIIKDFNFSPLPSNFTFRTDFDRNYNEVKLRNVFEDVDIKIDSTVNKDFLWNRFYDLRWDLTRSLKFDFSATNVARIDEMPGAYDWFRPGDNKEWSDSIWTNILNGGTNTNYDQSFNVTYSVPFNKFPAIDWLTSSVRYNGKMSWDRGPFYEGGYTLGHNLSNSNTIQLNGQVGFTKFFNKAGFIKRINSKYSGGRQTDTDKRTKKVNYSRRTFLKANTARSIIHKLGTEDIVVSILDADGNEIDVKVEIISENKITVTADADYTGVTVNIEGTVVLGENPLVFIAENTVRFLTGIKNISITYSQSGGTMLMGYMPETDYFGLNSGKVNNNFKSAPGIPFILGYQDVDFVRDMDEDWLTKDPAFSNPYIMTNSENINIRSTFEPFRGFRIDFTAQRTYSENISEYFIYETDSFRFDNRMKTGNYSISFISISSAFESISSDNNYYSSYFEKFKKYRKTIAARLFRKKVEESGAGFVSSVQQESEEGYPYGYGPTSSEVLIPAFLAAYGNKNPKRVTLERFPGIFYMLPNWRITFDGLSRIEFVKKFMRSINISHSYRSSYNIGDFTTNFYYVEEGAGLEFIKDFQNNFIPEFQINTVSIREDFSPLINFDMTWQNSLITRFEIKKSRTLALSLSNNQLTETRNGEIVIGAGYRFKEVPLEISGRKYESDLNVRFDLSVRDNKTLIRHLAQMVEDEVDQITAGQRVIKISTTADYALSARFNIQFFFDRTLNKPYTSRSFLTADTNIGFSVRFTLAQ
jgi:cell surface protein SprA